MGTVLTNREYLALKGLRLYQDSEWLSEQMTDESKKVADRLLDSFMEILNDPDPDLDIV